MNREDTFISNTQISDYTELKNILINETLLSYWQSIQNIQTNEQYGFELLVRGPMDSKLHTADKLFGVAIKNNKSDNLEILCLDIHLSRLKHIDTLLNMTVNISPKMLFNKKILELLSVYPTPQNIKLELTEHYPINEWEPIKEKMNQLRAFGYEFWLDDVGCGYFDLDLINVVQPEVVKLCIKLMKRLTSGEELINELQTVVTKVHEYGGKVLAEGIEEQWQLNIVRQLGVNYAQGYYFDKPRLVNLL